MLLLIIGLISFLFQGFKSLGPEKPIEENQTSSTQTEADHIIQFTIHITVNEKD